jgi:hypothetical protein
MIRFPWTDATVPHVVLEINQQCNISCRACYKRRRGNDQPMEAVLRDIEMAMSRCLVQTVCVVGAEPTLHPELVPIVGRLHGLGLKTSLFSNGLALEPGLLSRLKAAGLDIIMLHVDEGQNRPDLPPNPSVEATNALRTELAARIAGAGIDVGLSATIFPEHLDRVPAMVEFVLRCEHVNFLFATHYVDVQQVWDAARGRGAGGQVPSGALGRAPPRPSPRSTNRDTIRILRESLGLEPFAYLPSSFPVEPGEEFPSWVSYFVPVVTGPGGFRYLRVKSGWMDRGLLWLLRRLTGRFAFYVKPRSGMIAAHVVLNALARGRIAEAARFLAAARGPRGRLGAKRLVFDNGPMLTYDGRLACADPCPNRSVRNGRLAPVCLSDVEGRE